MAHVRTPRLEINRLGRVRTRAILQMESAECGAASLAIVFSYHGLFLSLERLREECGVSRDGTNAARLLMVARRYGFEAAGFRKEPEELAVLPAPAIIHWNFDHFVVFERLGKTKAWINDPARGRRAVTRAEFNRSFTGPVLVLRPGPAFRRRGSPPRVLPILLEWLAGSRSAIAFLMVVGVFLVIPGILVPVLSRVFVDRVLVGGHDDFLRPLFIGMVCASVCRGLLTWLQRDTLSRLSYRLVAELSAKYLRRALELPFSFFLARHPGDVAARVEIGDRLSWLLAGDLPAMALSSLLVVFYIIVMFVLEPFLALITVVFAASASLLDLLGAAIRSEKAERLAHEQARLLGVTVGGLQSLETLKANGVESRFLERWLTHQSRMISAHRSWALSVESFSAVTRFLYSIGMVVVLGVGAARAMEDRISVGTLVAFHGLMASFFGPLGDLAAFVAKIDEIRPQIARFRDVLEHPVEAGTVPVAEWRKPGASRVASTSKLKGRVDFRHVTFGYDRLRPPVVTELDFSVPPGSRIAIVGPTGSGKSTVALLLTGLFSPWGGEVLIDGYPRQRIPPELLVSSIAAVEQEIHIFDGTIAENLSFWDPAIQRGALARAIRDACLDEMIDRLPAGLETRLVEGGRNLSGGERQRIEIARALARSPSILVLDEATSALDSATERRIYENIRRRGCSCIIVAHRLSAIRDSDEILVLDAGRITQRGRHDGLWRKRGLYRDLILAESENAPC